MPCFRFILVAWVWLCLLICVAAATSASISLSGPTATVSPGKTLTLVLRGNDLNGPTNVDLTLPTGWESLFPAPTLTEGNEAEFIVVSVPEGARAGVYPVVALADSGMGHAEIEVRVVEVRQLTAAVLNELPERAQVGDEISATFLLRNEGNVDLEVEPRVVSSSQGRIDWSPRSVTLVPGSTSLVEATLQLTGRLVDVESALLIFSASAPGLTEPAVASSRTVIFPSSGIQAESGFRPWRAEVAAFVGVRDDEGNDVSFSFSGTGELDDDGEHRLEWLFRGPSQSSTNLGSRTDDRLYAAYFGPRAELRVGDFSYSVNRLLEFGRLARGVSGKLNFIDGSEIGAALRSDQRSAFGEDSYSAFWRTEFSGEQLLQASVLHRSRSPVDGGTSANLAGLAYETGFGDGTLVMNGALSSAEGLGGGAGQVRASRSWNDNRHRANFSGLYASTDFAGAFRDGFTLSGAFSSDLTETNSVRTDAVWRRRNLERSPQAGPAGEDVNFSATVTNRALLAPTDVSYGAWYYTREDRLAVQSFDFNAVGAHLGVNRSGNRFNFFSTLDLGVLQDDLRNSEETIYFAQIGAGYRLRPDVFFSGSLGRGKDRFVDQPSESTTAALRMRYENGSLDADARLSATFYESGSLSDVSQARAGIRYTLWNDHQLELQVDHRRTRFNDSIRFTTDRRVEDVSSAFLIYRIPFGVNWLRRNDAIRLRGRVVDVSSPGAYRPVSRAEVAVGSRRFLSDEEGLFEGYIGRSTDMSASLSTTALPPGFVPVSQNVRPRASEVDDHVMDVTLPIAKAASLEIRLEAAGDAEVDVALRGLVSARRNGMSRTGLLRLNESLRLDSLAPGEWTVTLMLPSLPPRFELRPVSQTVELSAASSGEIVFLIVERPERNEILEEIELEPERIEPNDHNGNGLRNGANGLGYRNGRFESGSRGER